MALFEKTLQGIKNLDSVLSTAANTFKTEKERIMGTYKEDVFVQKVNELKKVFDETVEQQKQACRETVQSDFSAVRERINKVVTVSPPADFPATLEAVRVSGKSISDYEATVLLEKYNGNYLAYRTLAEVLHQQGKAEDVLVMQPDAILREIEDTETKFMQIINDGSISLWGALFLEEEPTMEDMVQRFLDGQYVKV